MLRLLLAIPLCLSPFLTLKAQPVPERILDMTYPFDDQTIFWPNGVPFELQKGNWGPTERGWWYASNQFCTPEHAGTHVDAPIHFWEKGRTLDRIPLSEWIGPAARIDVTAKCAENRDYRLQVQDIRDWEARYGKLPPKAWVIMYTGIGTRHYPDREKVLGTSKFGSAALEELSFPGFSAESVEFLVKERDIAGIAIDTPSIDYGKSKDFEAHRVLSAADKPDVENIANLDKLPPAGAVLYVIPMTVRDGTGGPARVFAILP
jgi:kynurenine formamidase